jgi:4-hydroxybenzoate polyprenyltransferase
MRPALGAWMGERFPARNAVFFAVFHATALLVARAASAPGAVALGWRDLPGFVALWSFFLALRIADEHKDFAADAIAHPTRVLQRGLIGLRHLQVVGALAVAVQLVVSLWLDGGAGPVTGWWIAALAWSALMAREFFARAWLRRHLLAYAASHMAVMPLLALWSATMGDPAAAESPVVWSFAALAYLAGLAFEMARKLRAPADEHPMADSYTQALGIPAAATLLAFVVTAAATASLGVTMLAAGRAGIGATAALGAAIVLAIGAIGRFRRHPSASAAKRSEAAVGIAALTTHVVPVAAVLTARGWAP